MASKFVVGSSHGPQIRSPHSLDRAKMGGGSGVGDEEAEAEAAAAAEVTGRGGARGDVGGGGGGAGEAAAAVRTGGERRRRCGRVGGVEIPGGVGSQLAANSEVNDAVVPANSEVRLRFQVACLSGSVSTSMPALKGHSRGLLLSPQIPNLSSPKLSPTPMTGRYYTPQTHPPPPPENTLDVFMDGDTIPIHTTITSSHSLAAQFINEIARERPQGGLIVGIDTEWRTDHLPDGKTCYKVAVLQLCVGRRCLVFQIYQAGNMVPHELAEFLADPSVRFVGVAVNNDMQRLANDCNLRVACAVDLRYAAAAVLGQPELARAGLKRLALTVMGAHMEKEKNITKSRWGEPTLTWEQVNYACIDAYVSYEIGRRLLSGEPILAAPL